MVGKFLRNLNSGVNEMRKIGFVLIWVVLLGCGVVVGIESNSVLVSTAVECNSVDVSAVVKAETAKNIQVVTEGESKITGESKNIDIYEHAIKAYQQSVTSLQWALGIIVGLVSVVVLLLLFKNNQEYKEALREVREASRGTQDALKETKDTAREAEKELNKIREQGKALRSEIAEDAEKELNKIREQGKEVKSDIAKDVEREREVSKLWIEGDRALNSKDYIEAAAKFEMITAISPHDYKAYTNWGAALSDISALNGGDKELLEEAISKYKKAIEIRPDYYEAYSNWGEVIIRLSVLKGVDKGLLGEAEHILLKAEDIKRGSGAYNLACVRCRLDDVEGCEKWLQVGEEEGKLETRDHAMGDDDLEKVRGDKWFKELKWKGEK